MSRIAKTIFITGIILMPLSYHMGRKLPPKESILRSLYDEPVQVKTDKKPFDVEKKGIVYNVIPLFEYELWGLIVSVHHSDSWIDASHKRWKDYLNIKDVAVIWGGNIESGVYPKIKFFNRDFTWNARAKRDVWKKFKYNYISNNHIVAVDESVEKTIMASRRGDQVHVKGYLVDYSHSNGKFWRRTSTSRQDRGNRSCEVVYVTGFSILKRSQVKWRRLFTASLYMILISSVFCLIDFFNSGSKI
ncbi:hypothetical protein ACFLTD_02215 [Elusimicrobiota bacterium]